MTPLVLSSLHRDQLHSARGLAGDARRLRAERSGLTPCAFETVTLDTYVGEVTGVDATRAAAQRSPRNSSAATTASPGSACSRMASPRPWRRAAARYGAARVGVFLGTSTSGILETELAYRRRDPVSGALPADFPLSRALTTPSRWPPSRGAR